MEIFISALLLSPPQNIIPHKLLSKKTVAKIARGVSDRCLPVIINKRYSPNFCYIFE